MHWFSDGFSKNPPQTSDLSFNNVLCDPSLFDNYQSTEQLDVEPLYPDHSKVYSLPMNPMFSFKHALLGIKLWKSDFDYEVFSNSTDSVVLSEDFVNCGAIKCNKSKLYKLKMPKKVRKILHRRKKDDEVQLCWQDLNDLVKDLEEDNTEIRKSSQKQKLKVGANE